MIGILKKRAGTSKSREFQKNFEHGLATTRALESESDDVGTLEYIRLSSDTRAIQ